GDHVENEVGANESRAAGYEQHGRYSTWRAAMTCSGVMASMQRARGHSTAVLLQRLIQETSRLNTCRWSRQGNAGMVTSLNSLSIQNLPLPKRTADPGPNNAATGVLVN